MKTLDKSLSRAHDDEPWARQILAANLCDVCRGPFATDETATVCDRCCYRVQVLLSVFNSLPLVAELVYGDEEEEFEDEED